MTCLILALLLLVSKPQSNNWHQGQVTVYAKKFEGRPMASGKRFRHSGHYMACRSGRFGARIELCYGKNGRTVCVISDRGRLKLHRPNCWQFDLPKQAAKELGLYKKTKSGKTDRLVKWRYIR